MEGKVVVITGAGSGLGACLARKFSAAGARVVMLDISQENLNNTANKLENQSACYALDISSKAEVEETFMKIYKEVGNIDLLINCAGVGKYDLAERIDEKFVHAMIDINLKGAIFCIQSVLGPMKKENHGSIINVISMSGKRAVATESVYCASKFGLDGFIKSVALELADTEVRVMGFYMGNMATNLWKGSRDEDMPKFIKPEDMADIIFENSKLRDNLCIEEVCIKNMM